MPFPFDYFSEERQGFLNFGADSRSDSNESQETNSKSRDKYLCLFQTQWTIWRTVSGLMGLFFFAAAYVQHNDPDPYLWVPAYIIPCVISWAVALGLTVKKYYKPVKSRTTSPTGSRNITFPTPCHNDGNSQSRRSHSSPDKDVSHEKTTEENDTPVLISKYGSANTKLNWIISLHILYCFALGLWTIGVYIHESREVISVGLGPKERAAQVEKLTMLGHKLKMDPSTEEAKELMGLCIIIAWLSLLRHNNYILLGKTGICIGVFLTIIPFVTWALIEIYEQESKC